MPAVIRRLRFADGSLRMGPDCFQWHDVYERSLSFEVTRVNVAVIGGLNWRLSRQEYRWVEHAMIQEGLRMAMERVIRDDDGNVIGRRLVLMAMPARRRNLDIIRPAPKFRIAA